MYNANVFVHPTGSYEFWQGVVPVSEGDQPLTQTDRQRAATRSLYPSGCLYCSAFHVSTALSLALSHVHGTYTIRAMTLP